MTRRPTWLWLCGVAVLLLGAPPLFLWLLYPHEKPLPVEVFFPEHLSAAVRLTDLESAWRAHWSARPGADPDTALRDLMDAFDSWPAWVKKYGETGARLRLSAYQTAVTSLAGEEAWILFGAWDGAKPAQGIAPPGQVGLVLLLRGANQVGKRVGPITSLLLGETRVTTSQRQGVKLYEYKDKHADRSITFGQVGGWLVASWWQQGLGPLPVIIDRVREAQAAPAQRLANSFSDFWPGVDPLKARPALAAVFFPRPYWGQLRQFDAQRGEKSTPEDEQSLLRWQQRLDGVDRVSLLQTGKSLFDLRATIAGPRPTLLEKQMTAASDPSPFTGAAATDGGGAARVATTAAGHEFRGAAEALAAQIDLTMPMARSLAPLWGDPWEDWLASLKKIEAFIPGLTATLSPHFLGTDPTEHGRTGLAIFRSAVPIYPKLLFWAQKPPETPPTGLPALAWAAATPADRATTSSASRWLASTADFAPPTSSTQTRSIQPMQGEALWQAAPFPPAAFLTFKFQPFIQEIDAFPKFLLKTKKDRKNLDSVGNMLRGFNLAIGDGLAARLDLTPTQWILVTKPL